MRTVVLVLLGLYTAAGGGWTLTDSDEPGGPAFAWDDASSGTQVSFIGFPDDAQTSVALPFPFVYFGVPFTSVNVCTNGFIQFGGFSSANFNTQIPSAAAPNGLVCVFWDDLLLNAGSSVRTMTLGTAGTRRFVIQWNAVQQLGGPSGLTFQVALFETTNVIRMQYQSIASANDTATIGAENTTGTDGLEYVFNATPAANVATDGLAIQFVPAPLPPTPPAPPPLPEDEEGPDYNCSNAAGLGGAGTMLALAAFVAFGTALLRR